MRAYISVFRIRFIAALQYRAAALSSMATGLAWGFMELLAFRAFYNADPAAFPMEFSRLVSYVWMQEAFITLFSLGSSDPEFSGAIESGLISYELARPIRLYERWFCQDAANRLAKGMLRGAPILLLAFLLPAPFRFSLPPDLAQFAVFLVSALLALIVVVAFSMLMYISVFVTLSSRGTKLVVGLIAYFLSGGVIPLPFFPNAVRSVIEYTPFAMMMNMPLRIYSGDIMGESALLGVFMQIIWAVALVIISQLCMNKALKRVIVQGG